LSITIHQQSFYSMHIGAFGRGDSLWNRPFSHISDLCDHDLDWPWVWSYGIPSCITHRPLPIRYDTIR